MPKKMRFNKGVFDRGNNATTIDSSFLSSFSLYIAQESRVFLPHFPTLFARRFCTVNPWQRPQRVSWVMVEVIKDQRTTTLKARRRAPTHLCPRGAHPLIWSSTFPPSFLSVSFLSFSAPIRVDGETAVGHHHERDEHDSLLEKQTQCTTRTFVAFDRFSSVLFQNEETAYFTRYAFS